MCKHILNFVGILMIILSVQTAWAGGFIIVMPDQHSDPNIHNNRINPALFPLETRSTKIVTNIMEQTASTSIEQVFYNPGSRQLEGYFLFPVPKNVVISKFTMNINGKEHEAELLDAGKARQIYEQIVRKVEDPALLEYYNNELFRVRIFPILPKSEQRIRLTYTETLKKDNGTIAYQLPLNTQKYSAKPIQELSFKINIEGKNDLKTVYCPTHQTEIIRKGDKKAIIGFKATKIQSDRDLKVYFNMDEHKVGMSMLHYKEKKEDGYFFLNLNPGTNEQNLEVVEKDIVFVMDKSGSMSGEKLEQAKKALKFCVDNLNEGDRFEIIPFSTEATSLFGKTEKVNKNSKEEAYDFIDDIRAVGGTNIDEALEMALASQEVKNDRPFFIIFMTDGKPTIGETQESRLLEKLKENNKGNTRIFTFGIGTNLNTHLLDKLTEMTNGYRTYVLPDEDIEIKVSNFYVKAASPVLTDLKLSFDKNIRISDVYPKKLPDLFKGSSLSLMGRFKGTGKGKVTLTGKINGKEHQFVYDMNFEEEKIDYEFIPDLWASRAVGYLLDQIRLHGESEELKEEVVRLAKKHGIITPYTSYLILEDENTLTNSNSNIPRPRLLPETSLEPEPMIEEDIAIFRSNAEKRKSGARSITLSQKNQEMRMADNLDYNGADLEINDQVEPQIFTNFDTKNDIVNVRGRAMYNNNNHWVDSNLNIADTDKMTRKRVKFNSKEYFSLLQDDEAAEFLALGRNVEFMMNNTIYEIYQ
ncbi:MAG: VIT and VWA domain-containing protein [Saprospiraceae bacterium]|nr:VIT and VWA domain-containing protein [Saprospiraceae bacterium]